MAGKYNLTTPEWYALKLVTANPNYYSGTSIDPNSILIISAKTDELDREFNEFIADLPQYTGLTNYLSIYGGEIFGDLTVSGKIFALSGITAVEAENLTTTGATILLNSGEGGAGVTAGSSGMIIDRGTSPWYELKFYENQDVFRLGQTGNTQAIATREDYPQNNFIPIWDDSTKSFITTINPNDITTTAYTQTLYNTFYLFSGNTNSYLIFLNNKTDIISGKTDNNTTNINIINSILNSYTGLTQTNINDISQLRTDLNLTSGKTDNNATNINTLYSSLNNYSGQTQININQLRNDLNTTSGATNSNTLLTNAIYSILGVTTGQTQTNISNIDIISGKTDSNTNSINNVNLILNNYTGLTQTNISNINQLKNDLNTTSGKTDNNTTNISALYSSLSNYSGQTQNNASNISSLSGYTTNLSHSQLKNIQGGVNSGTTLESFHLSQNDYTDKIINRRFGNTTGYTEFESNGFLHVSGYTAYDDLQMPFTAAKTGSNVPDWNAIAGTGIYSYSFPSTKESEVFVSAEIPHTYLEGSPIEAHVHWYSVSSNVSGATVLFQIEYTLVNVGRVITGSTILYTTGVTNGIASQHIYTSYGTINPTLDTKISAGFTARVARVVGGTYNDSVIITRLALHYKKDTLGSRTMMTKY